VRVALVCATRGEAGDIADPSLATPETLGQVREAELRCAALTLGLSDLILLDYRDSGMAGAPANAHPQALIQADAVEIVTQLVGIIRRLRPQVVVTFEPNGGYGHPDHIAIHRHAVAAFHAAADPLSCPEQGQPWQAARLFYTSIARSFFATMRVHMVTLGMDTTEFDGLMAGGVGWPDEEINTILDVTDAVDAKWAAFQCHSTQFGPDQLFRRLPDDDMKRLLSHEYFALTWPSPAPGLHLTDLFADL
jgi:LmbE family N-acetylglucosaminyl deacetylase